MAMRFDFTAIERASGRRAPSSLTIGDATPVAPSHGDFSCEAAVEGFATETKTLYGAFAFQAVLHAMQIAATLLASHERLWDFYFSDDGPVSFTDLNTLRGD
jgi:hypothetical protein